MISYGQQRRGGGQRHVGDLPRQLWASFSDGRMAAGAVAWLGKAAVNMALWGCTGAST